MKVDDPALVLRAKVRTTPKELEVVTIAGAPAAGAIAAKRGDGTIPSRAKT